MTRNAGFAALLFLALGLPGSAPAAPLTLDQLKARIDAEMSKGDEYAQLLNDPDPARAQAAMRVMLESGDPEMRRIALQYGVFSPDPVVRGEAVQAFFEGKPVVQVHMDGARAEADTLQRVLDFRLGVALNPEAEGVWMGKLTEIAPDGTCYKVTGWPPGCLFRAVGGTLQLQSTDARWYEVKMTDDGHLRSVVTLKGNGNDSAGPVTLSIPVR